MHCVNVARSVVGAFVTLYEELRRDEKEYFNYFRVSKDSFDELLNNRLNPLLYKQNTRMRDVISPTERLAVSLRQELRRHTHNRRTE